MLVRLFEQQMGRITHTNFTFLIIVVKAVFLFLVGTFLALLNILKNKIGKTISILFGAGYEA
jgi:hypothetical protein